MRTIVLEVNWLFYGLIVLFIYLLRVTFQALSHLMVSFNYLL